MEKTGCCTCGDKHHAHMCMLKSNGLTAEISKITTNPQYYCFTCAAEADCAENLCEPAEIKN